MRPTHKSGAGPSIPRVIAKQPTSNQQKQRPLLSGLPGFNEPSSATTAPPPLVARHGRIFKPIKQNEPKGLSVRTTQQDNQIANTSASNDQNVAPLPTGPENPAQPTNAPRFRFVLKHGEDKIDQTVAPIEQYASPVTTPSEQATLTDNTLDVGTCSQVSTGPKNPAQPTDAPRFRFVRKHGEDNIDQTLAPIEQYASPVTTPSEQATLTDNTLDVGTRSQVSTGPQNPAQPTNAPRFRFVRKHGGDNIDQTLAPIEHNASPVTTLAEQATLTDNTLDVGTRSQVSTGPKNPAQPTNAPRFRFVRKHGGDNIVHKPAENEQYAAPVTTAAQSNIQAQTVAPVTTAPEFNPRTSDELHAVVSYQSQGESEVVARNDHHDAPVTTNPELTTQISDDALNVGDPWQEQGEVQSVETFAQNGQYINPIHAVSESDVHFHAKMSWMQQGEENIVDDFAQNEQFANSVTSNLARSTENNDGFNWEQLEEDGIVYDFAQNDQYVDPFTSASDWNTQNNEGRDVGLHWQEQDAYEILNDDQYIDPFITAGESDNYTNDNLDIPMSWDEQEEDEIAVDSATSVSGGNKENNEARNVGIPGQKQGERTQPTNAPRFRFVLKHGEDDAPITTPSEQATLTDNTFDVGTRSRVSTGPRNSAQPNAPRFRFMRKHGGDNIDETLAPIEQYTAPVTTPSETRSQVPRGPKNPAQPNAPRFRFVRKHGADNIDQTLAPIEQYASPVTTPYEQASLTANTLDVGTRSQVSTGPKNPAQSTNAPRYRIYVREPVQPTNQIASTSASNGQNFAPVPTGPKKAIRPINVHPSRVVQNHGGPRVRQNPRYTVLNQNIPQHINVHRFRVVKKPGGLKIVHQLVRKDQRAALETTAPKSNTQTSEELNGENRFKEQENDTIANKFDHKRATPTNDTHDVEVLSQEQEDEDILKEFFYFDQNAAQTASASESNTNTAAPVTAATDLNTQIAAVGTTAHESNKTDVAIISASNCIPQISDELNGGTSSQKQEEDRVRQNRHLPVLSKLLEINEPLSAATAPPPFVARHGRIFIKKSQLKGMSVRSTKRNDQIANTSASINQNVAPLPKGPQNPAQSTNPPRFLVVRKPGGPKVVYRLVQKEQLAAPVTTAPESNTQIAAPVTTDPESNTPVASPVTTAPDLSTQIDAPVTTAPESNAQIASPVTTDPESNAQIAAPETTDPESNTPVASPVTTPPDLSTQIAAPVTTAPESNSQIAALVTTAPDLSTPTQSDDAITASPRCNPPTSDELNSEIISKEQEGGKIAKGFDDNDQSIVEVTTAPELATPTSDDVEILSQEQEDENILKEFFYFDQNAAQAASDTTAHTQTDVTSNEINGEVPSQALGEDDVDWSSRFTSWGKTFQITHHRSTASFQIVDPNPAPVTTTPKLMPKTDDKPDVKIILQEQEEVEVPPTNDELNGGKEKVDDEFGGYEPQTYEVATWPKTTKTSDELNVGFAFQTQEKDKPIHVGIAFQTQEQDEFEQIYALNGEIVRDVPKTLAFGWNYRNPSDVPSTSDKMPKRVFDFEVPTDLSVFHNTVAQNISREKEPPKKWRIPENQPESKKEGKLIKRKGENCKEVPVKRERTHYKTADKRKTWATTQAREIERERRARTGLYKYTSNGSQILKSINELSPGGVKKYEAEKILARKNAYNKPRKQADN